MFIRFGVFLVKFSLICAVAETRAHKDHVLFWRCRERAQGSCFVLAPGRERFVIMAYAKNDLRSFLFQYLRLHLLRGMCCYLFGADGGPEAGVCVCFLCLAINLFWPMSLEVDLGCVFLQEARLAWNEYHFRVSTNIMFRSLTYTERVSFPVGTNIMFRSSRTIFVPDKNCPGIFCRPCWFLE